MSKKSKWLDDVSADDPVEKVARVAVAARIDTVRDYLARAASEPISETENVHQLRVSTRRAAAAMRHFASLLPPRRAEWISKRLKRIRRAAGAARDLDITLLRLADLEDGAPTARFEPLAVHLAQERQRVQRPILRLARKLNRQDFAGRQEAMLEKVRLRTPDEEQLKPTLRFVARRALRELSDAFFTAGVELTTHERLHAFRIQGKKLRYASELFVAAFSSRLREEIYPQLEQLQDLLGRLCDVAAFDARAKQWRRDAQDDSLVELVDELVAIERRAARDARQEFDAWWTAERIASLRHTFDECLDVAELPAHS